MVLVVAAFLTMASQRVSAQSDGPIVNAIDLDIAPAELDKYLAAVKENGVATVKEPGCREFNIMVSATNPNHVFLFEVYDNDAAAQAHRTTEHFKKYAATTANKLGQRLIILDASSDRDIETSLQRSYNAVPAR
jgi:(4S)-4-hydroxy-5-phosphonooxypentane-2,3-dione isomerase